ncbi:MAG TPA: hypothetical protein VEJ43_04365 [Pseudolabrys sp.]|nr:hypothetical protein [Pseudolabrys sp.]
MRHPELQHRSSPPAIPTARDALAPNRAIGRIALTVGANGNRTRKLAVHEAGSLVRFIEDRGALNDHGVMASGTAG